MIRRMALTELEALDLVDRHRVPILDREGHRTFWRIVSVTGHPGEHLNDALHLHVHFPAGSERGPLIDRHAVRIRRHPLFSGLAVVTVTGSFSSSPLANMLSAIGLRVACNPVLCIS